MDNSKESLKNALIQALSEKYNEELEKCSEESDQYSYRHYKRMCAISGTKFPAPVYIRKVKRRVVAALIAAATLLLIGCTAIVYKEKIGSFFTETYQDHIEGAFVESEEITKEYINEYYTLTYVPEGYELVENKTGKALAQSVWKNANGMELVLVQLPINSGSYFMDNEKDLADVIEMEKFSVYYCCIDGTYRCFWNNKEYAFALYFDNEMSKDEIINIILNMDVISK